MYIKSSVAVFAVSLIMPALGQGQQAGVSGLDLLEEVIVTARKREENLKDVPVSVSVLTADVLDAAGIIEVGDLFNLLPGMDYNISTSGERTAARPSIRGVQADNGGTNVQKVNTFVDGLPTLASQGTQQFLGIQRVETYRGPQSAAFGRSTFAGAINYVTADPTEEFESTFELTASDLNRRGFKTSLSGPISETLGYTFNLNRTDFLGPDDWVTTEENTIGGARDAYVSGKLKWTPNNRFDAEFRLSHLETFDDSAARWRFNSFPYIDADGNVVDDVNGNGILDHTEGTGNEITASTSSTEWYATTPWAQCANWLSPLGTWYIRGEWNCDERYGDVPDGGVPANTVPSNQPIAEGLTFDDVHPYDIIDPGVTQQNDRFQSQINVEFASGSLEVLTLYALSESLNWRDNDITDMPIINACSTMMMVTTCGIQIANTVTQANISESQEQMIEARWVSPGENSLRYVVGASYYAYDYESSQKREYIREIEGTGPADLRSQTSDLADNSGIFGNVSYDLTDRLTGSLEARWQRDEVENRNLLVPGLIFNFVTETFQPRLALNYTVNESVSMYAQIAQGVNPAGGVADTQTPIKREIAEFAREVGLIGYSIDDYLHFPEETITNYEVGFKANLAGGRVSIASALYVMDWEHYNQSQNVNFVPLNLAEDLFAVGGSVPGSEWDPAGPDGDSDPDTGPNNAYENVAFWWDGTGGAYGANSTGALLENNDAMIMGSRLDLGTVEVYGLEVDAVWAISDSWRLRGSLTLQNTEFQNFCSADAIRNFGLDADPEFADRAMTVAEDGVPFDCIDATGNSLLQQPDRQAAVSLRYDNTLGSSEWRLQSNLAWAHKGPYFMDEMNFLTMPELNVVNASIGLRNPAGNLRITLSGRNMLNDRTPRGWRIDGNRFVGNAREPSLIPQVPREISLILRYDL